MITLVVVEVLHHAAVHRKCPGVLAAVQSAQEACILFVMCGHACRHPNVCLSKSELTSWYWLRETCVMINHRNHIMMKADASAPKFD